MVEINLFKHSRDVIELDTGAVLFNHGDTGDCMYAVVEGAVALTVGGVQVEEVGPGGILGEMALIDRSPRSATASAVTATRVACVDQQQFSYLVQEHPTFALQVMSAMAERLRRANRPVDQS